MSDHFPTYVSILVIIGVLSGGALLISSQTSAQVSSLSTQNLSLSSENINLQNQVTNLNNQITGLNNQVSSLSNENAVLTQQVNSMTNEIQSLQTSFSQSPSGVLTRFAVYELMRESISGSSVIATCASAPLTNFIKSYTGVDLSNQIASLIQSSLLTASFQLSNMSPTSTNTYSATGTTTVRIQVPSPIGSISIPVHADVGVSATVDVYNLSVSNLSCTSVSVAAG